MQKDGMGLPAGLAIGLHVLIVVLLGVSLDFNKTPKMPQPQGEPITAKAVDSKAIEDQVKRIKSEQAAQRKAEVERQQKLEDQRQAELKRIAELKQQQADAQKQAEDAKKVQAEEQQKAKELEIARQKKLEEKKKAEAEAKAADEKRKKAEAQAKAEEEKRKQEELARKKAAAEKKRKEEAERQRKLAEKQLADQMAAEAQQRAQARQKQVLTELEKYQALIVQQINQNIIRDESMKGKEAQVHVTLAPSGLVLDVKYVSGDKSLYDAVQRALWKIQTLPVSKDPDVFAKMRDLNLTYRPEF
ncbi:cell envelope integrity protein TolA [Gallaecimonas mangrovi]|uniref:cell envelope integrity protein TolA n=1 Tax=Gallaecimonas mangrovi TaxID=2291597 RepID=UPI000E1FEB45|nr:cell envelope integrity protein TolA [Gallaecimonas mangrovi]